MAERVMNRLGEGLMHIITRILGLILTALAVQYILNGVAEFYRGLIG
jgi:multiple antibiotic resistance protein